LTVRCHLLCRLKIDACVFSVQVPDSFNVKLSSNDTN